MALPIDIIDKIIRSEKEFKEQIWLIPSENLPSPFARVVQATSGANRYLFKHELDGKIICPGTEIYQEMYDYCTKALADLFKAEFVSLRPLSGMTGMTMVITTYTDAGDVMFSMDPAVGGHTHTEKIALSLGRKVTHIPMVVHDDVFFIDYEALERMLRAARPKLLYLDPMSYSYQFDLTALRRITPETCALHYDTSHVMSFVAGGLYPNALDHGFASLGGSTHKTMPAAQKGFFATNSAEHFQRFEKLSGQIVSSLHISNILALAVTLSETGGDFYTKYAQDTLANALHCCSCLEESGFKVFGRAGKKTDCHVVFMGVKEHCEATEAANLLSQAGIITHPTTLPIVKPEKGLRLGLQEMTALGMGKTEVDAIVDIMKNVLIDRQPPSKYRGVVSDLRRKFKAPSFAFEDSDRMKSLVDALLT